MKYLMPAILSGVLILGILIPGCTVGSGNPTTTAFDYTGFTKIQAANGFELAISISDEYSIEVTADDNIISNLDIKKQNETLLVTLKPGSYVFTTLKAKITLPQLSEIELNAGSRAELDFNSADPFIAVLSGGSQWVGVITAGKVTIELSGGSLAAIEGSASDLNLVASGGSRSDLSGLTAEQATIDVSGGSNVDINVTGTLSADVSGGSRVTYKGSPTLGTVDVSGGSTLKQG